MTFAEHMAAKTAGVPLSHFSHSATSGFANATLVAPVAVKRKPPRKLPRVIWERDVDVFLKSADCARDLMLLEVGLFMCLRVAEICRLNIEHFDWPACRAFIQFAKGGKERWVPVNTELRGHLLKWIEPRSRGPVFPSTRSGKAINERMIQRIVNRVWRRSGIQGPVTPHVLRHTGATRMVQKDVPLRVVQVILGHQRVTTTEIYAHVSDRAALEAVNRLDFLHIQRQREMF